MEIDPRFKAARQNAERRRKRGGLRGWLIGGGAVLVLLASGVGLWLGGVLTFSAPGIGPDAQLVESGEPAEDPAASYVSPFVDIAGDPMVLRFDASAAGAEKSRAMLRPLDLGAARVGPELVLLQDEMVTGQERLITTLPSSREDFAFFQAQREAPPPFVAPVVSPPVEGDDTTDGEGSWGTNLDGSTDAPVAFERTKIEDTTSVAFVVPEAQRKPPVEDVFLRLKEPGKLDELMAANGMDAAAAGRFASAAIALLPGAATLGPGHILALRGVLRGGLRVPVQMSLYTRDSYLGSVALNDAGVVVLAADPWVAEDLFSYAGDAPVTAADTSRKYRLLDAFYSAAIRNGVPSAVVGETIVLMSQAHDLEAFASPGDKMTLLYSRTPGSDGPGPGQVLYAAIKGEGRLLECNVFYSKEKDGFTCFGAPGAAVGGGGGVGLRSGLITPTKGVLTSRYGPRMHPILKVMKLHEGVDWAAPVGTPVMAAFDGSVLSAGDGGSYGNVVKITHANGLETRYAHLNAFAPGLHAGQAVKAGDLIGYIGTTGRSTGPHLHFEVFENGRSVDPLSAGGGETAVAGSAVEVLTDQIIRVESGGSATAKNPLSSATGLGQFIEGTWIRMMTSYRPDLASTLTREALLALRNDPTLSREMVQNLAREGEAYLRARGHDITAGRLYLCHFLGAEGANKVLLATDAQLLADVLGEGVIGANPFLKGQTVGYVKQWAENKMSGHRGGPALVPVALPPEVQAYVALIQTLLKPPA